MHKLIFQCVWKGTQTRRSQHLVGSVARCSFGGDLSALYDITKGQFPKKMSVLSHTSKGWMDFVSWDDRHSLEAATRPPSHSFAFSVPRTRVIKIFSHCHIMYNIYIHIYIIYVHI